MKHGSLFSGIGGFDLAAEWMGWENVFHCEWNEFGQRVLKYYWPDAECFTDITKTDFKKYHAAIDIISGGFPCQPYSHAGKRLGTADDRHLWPEMLRAIREIQPRYVVGENVSGIVSWNGGLVFHEIQTDLEAEGYEVQPFILPAVSVNAPHRRDRVWFVANNNCIIRGTGRNDKPGKQSRHGESILRTTAERVTSNTECKRSPREEHGEEKTRQHTEESEGFGWENFPTEPPLRGRNDGIPKKLGSITFPKWRNESIKAYGNAIVPQVAFQIFKAIQEIENGTISKNRI